ncbi:uncharacterized protein Z518_09759 [Rhinocladiella mackenziei CBS 650.93]|uniref:Transcription initiation factor TFIID subunit 8 n=1 Tax=Rhinocladiella mackenziei CBS 650.93 TaxID=1442369 RepID=A0A0D2I4H5_9EURO|nr:uncharacterized protein Z518_09759 [Rhinocladiella mackenziei CBS 650.93]KIX00694.1 hypothetical protein Z518_09759 [Rhinocladiella mackenziei CBS 650.93]
MSTTSPKRKVPYHHHHVMRHKLQALPTREPTLLEQETVDKLLIDCIKAICEEEALKQDISSPVIESVALEALVGAVEEFVLKFLSKVRRSMLAARRTTPIASDFETAIDVFDVPRLDDQLRQYKTNHSINPPLLLTPPPEDEFHNTIDIPPSFLDPELDGHGQLQKFSFNTKGLPDLPSAHTFKDSPVYPYREVDTRRIRELATQEGKLGEQALRKLAGAVKLDAAHPLDSEASRQKCTPRQRKRWKKGVDQSEETIFEETLRDLLAKEPGGFELGPIVTCEKAYRMPDDVQVKRRPHMNGAASSGQEKPASSGPSGPDVMEL